MAGVMAVNAGLKEITQKEAAAAAAVEDKLARKAGAAAKKLLKKLQHKKATREAQAILEAQWNAG